MIPFAAAAAAAAAGRNPWKLITAQEGTSFVIGNEEPYKNLRDNEGESIASVLSASEICMLEAVKKMDRFSSNEVRVVSRRPRQPVITRIVDLGLLDDTYAGVTKTLLSKCNNWAFNTFNLDVSTGGRSLSYLLVHLFQEYGFVRHFNLDIVKVWHCFNLMEAAYHRHNPYHNSVHAADVTQAMHCFLQENKFSAYLTPLEAMSSVIAAVAHDLDHPGVTQAFLVATSNHLVNLYHNSSVLENHHWRTAISCLSESGIFSHLDKEVWHNIQMQIRSLILATDITRQKEFLARFKNYLSSESLDMKKTQYRHFALQIALKCADLCNPCRPWAISQRWSYQVCQEFYRQGAYERQLKLPLTPTFDCSKTKVAKIQADFFQFVVSPLFETWDLFLKTPLSNQLLENLQHNFSIWEQRISAQKANENESLGVPSIKIDSLSSEGISSNCEAAAGNLLSAAEVVLKQHRSKSDSGLSPKIHMETYSTEELHPSTTLLSLSSITNAVQLRQVYATTKVESHLICPTIFQSISSNSLSKSLKVLPTEGCEETCSKSQDDEDSSAQCVVSSCPNNGCGTPSPEDSHLLDIFKTKPRSHSLVNGSEELKHCVRNLQNRRASDFDFYLCNTPETNLLLSNNETVSKLQDSYGTRLPSRDISNKSFLDSTKDTFTSNICSNAQCSQTSCICQEDSEKKIPSWCWHISRSFSAERPIRPSHDSPIPSVSSLNYKNRRRGSAPVAYSPKCDEDTTHHMSSLGDMGGLRGGRSEMNSAARRWSEASGLRAPPSFSEKGCHPLLSSRRRSFGLLEPLLTPINTDSSSLRHNQKSIHCSCHVFSASQDESCKPIASSSESFLPFPPPPPTCVQRRGSLPTNLYVSSEEKSSEMARSPGDLLSVLIGPSGLLNTMHGIGQTICERPCNVAQDFSRRRSGGLEMLSGLWKSRTNDTGGMASKQALRRQLLEAWRMDEGKPLSTSSSISIRGHPMRYQPRRGSVPINLSLTSENSGEQAG